MKHLPPLTCQWPDSLKMYKKAKVYQIYNMVQELLEFTLTYNGPQDGCLVKHCHRFALQCLDNVKMYKYAKFDKKNIPCGERNAEMMFTFLHTNGWTMMT